MVFTLATQHGCNLSKCIKVVEEKESWELLGQHAPNKRPWLQFCTKTLHRSKLASDQRHIGRTPSLPQTLVWGQTWILGMGCALAISEWLGLTLPSRAVSQSHPLRTEKKIVQMKLNQSCWDNQPQNGTSRQDNFCKWCKGKWQRMSWRIAKAKRQSEDGKGGFLKSRLESEFPKMDLTNAQVAQMDLTKSWGAALLWNEL